MLRRHKRDEPIVQSLLDNDFYVFTMGQLIQKQFATVNVTFSTFCRTLSAKLAERIDLGQLREELDHVRTLHFGEGEIRYLRGTMKNDEQTDRMFAESYLTHLRTLQLPEYDLGVENGRLKLDFPGLWSETVYWEVPALAIMVQLYYESFVAELSPFEREATFAKAITTLKRKIERLREYPSIKFSDFGTRRRFSRDWQFHVDEILATELADQFRGTSCIESAMKHNLLPMGTNAHQMEMVMAGLAESQGEKAMCFSQIEFLKLWWELYGETLSISLPDTFGSQFFFGEVGSEIAKDWRGTRQDSGIPEEYVEKHALPFYRKHGVDPSKKLVVFSDSLDEERIIQIHDFVGGRLIDSYGWGTNLTNDFGFPNLSLVIKPSTANGIGLVKLSDNLQKAIGRPEDVERYKHIFGYSNQYAEAPVH